MGMFDSLSGIGAGIGGLLGATGGGSRPAGNTTTTTVQDIPEWLKPYVTGNLNAAQTSRDSVAGAGNGLFAAAMPEYMKTIRGDYLNPDTNPWLKSTFNTSSDLVGSRINSIFEKGNRYGSGQQAGAIGMANTALANDIFGGNYQSERARQNAAITGVPNFNLVNETAAMFPYTSFAGLTPNLRSTAETTPYFTNRLGNAASGALAGGILGNAGGMPDVSSILASLGLGGGLEGGAGYASLLGGSASAAGGMSLADMLSAGLIAL